MSDSIEPIKMTGEKWQRKTKTNKTKKEAIYWEAEEVMTATIQQAPYKPAEIGGRKEDCKKERRRVKLSGRGITRMVRGCYAVL